MKACEQDSLKNKVGALMEGDKGNAVTLMLVPDAESSEQADKTVGEKEPVLLSHQKQQELLVLPLQEVKQSAECAKELKDDNRLQTLQVYKHNNMTADILCTQLLNLFCKAVICQC